MAAWPTQSPLGVELLSSRTGKESRCKIPPADAQPAPNPVARHFLPDRATRLYRIARRPGPIPGSHH